MSLTDALLLEAYRDHKDIFVSHRFDGLRGEGTAVNPYNGSTQALFDGLMRGFMAQNLEFISIHLGPGVFETKGTAPYDDAQGWEIRKGWKIIGSGIDVTTLKLVGAVAHPVLIMAIGPKLFTTVADSSEVRDLTVDCNFPTDSPPPVLGTAAVVLKGNHVRIRRVRAIGFGTYQPVGGEEVGGPESFVLAVGGRAANLAEPLNCVIEDCIVEKRADVDGNNNCTCLQISSGEEPNDGVMEHTRGCVIRRNYVDGAFPDGTVNLTQQVWGCAGGGRGVVIEGNRFYNVRAGGPYHDTWPHGDSVVRGNYYRNVVVGPFENLTGLSATTKNIKLNSLTCAGTTATAVTLKAHGFVELDRALIVNRSPNAPTDPNDPNRYYYGDFLIAPDPSDPTKFTYQMSGTPQNSPPPASSHVPAYATRFLNPFDARRLLASLTYTIQGSQYIAEAKIANNEPTYGVAFEKHDFVPGDAVRIERASPSVYNDRFTITETPDEKTFKFVLKSNPGSNSPSGYYAKVWQTKKLIVENNVIELAPYVAGVTGFPIGVDLFSDDFQGPPFRFLQVVIRNNIIRHVNNQRIPGDPGLGIVIYNAESALIDGNTIALDVADPILHVRTGRVHSFNNRTPSGTVLEAYDPDTLKRTEDLSKKIQDALLLSY